MYYFTYLLDYQRRFLRKRVVHSSQVTVAKLSRATQGRPVVPFDSPQGQAQQPPRMPPFMRVVWAAWCMCVRNRNLVQTGILFQKA